MNNINLYDQSNIPKEVFEQMEELKYIEMKLKEHSQLIERKNDILNAIKKEFPQDDDAVAVKDGLVLFYKMGKRSIGDANLEALETINPSLIRVIPEKIIPAERKAQTLGNIEKWMELNDAPEEDRKYIYDNLDIHQSKSLVTELL